MNFLKKIFSKSKPKNDNIINNDNEIQTIELKVKGFIFAREVFWDSKILDSLEMLLDVIDFEEDIDTKLKFWNKLFYEKILEYVSDFNSSQIEAIAKILKIRCKGKEELDEQWPNKLTENEFELLYQLLKYDFVKFEKIREDQKGKFVIKINPSFWDVETYKGSLLANILNNIERELTEQFFFYDNIEDTKNWAPLIMQELNSQTYPENYLYKDIIIKQLPEISQIQHFITLKKPNDITLKEFRNKDFRRIINEMPEEIKFMRIVFELVENKPFHIIRVV